MPFRFHILHRLLPGFIPRETLLKCYRAIKWTFVNRSRRVKMDILVIFARGLVNSNPFHRYLDNLRQPYERRFVEKAAVNNSLGVFVRLLGRKHPFQCPGSGRIRKPGCRLASVGEESARFIWLPFGETIEGNCTEPYRASNGRHGLPDGRRTLHPLIDWTPQEWWLHPVGARAIR